MLHLTSRSSSFLKSTWIRFGADVYGPSTSASPPKVETVPCYVTLIEWIRKLLLFGPEMFVPSHMKQLIHSEIERNQHHLNQDEQTNAWNRSNMNHEQTSDNWMLHQCGPKSNSRMCKGTKAQGTVRQLWNHLQEHHKNENSVVPFPNRYIQQYTEMIELFNTTACQSTVLCPQTFQNPCCGAKLLDLWQLFSG